MITPSTVHFRLIAAVALLSWLAIAVMPHTGLIAFSEEVETARMWNYFGSALPFWLIQIWWGISALLILLGLGGLLRFWSPSRWLLAAALAASILIQPMLGLAVYSPFEASMAGVFGASTLWLVSVSFHSPLAARFERNVSEST